MGIAASMDLNPAIAAAAVISGAYFGDTSSPLSDSANLAAAAAGVDLYEHIRETAVTSGLALVIALAVFCMLGQPGDFDASEKMAAIQNVFQPTLLLFLPLLVVLALAILKFPPFTTIFLGALAGGAARRHRGAGAGYCVRRCRRRHSAVARAPEGRVARSRKRIQV